MYQVAIIKKRNLILDIAIQTLEEKFPLRNVLYYKDNQYEPLYKKVHVLDLVFIDAHKDMDESLTEFIQHCMNHHVKVVIWVSFVDSELLTKLFKLGLSGYFYREMETDELVEATKMVLKGQQYIHPHLSCVLLREYQRVTNKQPERPSGLLTDREWEVLELIIQGKESAKISEQLNISFHTVTNHIASILDKLNVSNRTSAALLAIRKGWYVF